MFHSTPRTRRHRNPAPTEEQQQQPFFTKAGHQPVQAKAAPFFQAKLTIGQPGDQYEQEADAVANKVVYQQSAAGQPAVQKQEISTVQRLATPDEEKMPGTNDERMAEDKAIQEKSEAPKQEEEKKPIQKMGAPKQEEEKKPSVQKKDAPKQEEDKKLQAMAAPEQKEEKKEAPIQKMDAPKKEEEKPGLQTKSNGQPAQPANLSSRLSQRQGKGEPLHRNVRSQMEQGIGADFSGVRIHNDSEAVDMNKDLHAQAFTHGSDIFFNAGKFNPEQVEGKRLLAHELTHVVQQGASGGPKHNGVHNNLSTNVNQSTILRQGLLDPAAERAAISHNRRLFDFRSVMIVQIITGSNVDGKIGPMTVEAIASYQAANGLAVNGKVDDATLTSFFKDRVTNDWREHALQLVTDYYNLDRSDVLSMHYDSSIFISNTNFMPGGLRVITFGDFAFLSPAWLKLFIEKELLTPAPAVPALGPKPTHLNKESEKAAISFNSSKFSDKRSIKAIQGFIGATPDGVFGTDTVERIAEHQHNNGLTTDGKIGEQTLWSICQKMHAANQQDAAIRLVMDYFNLTGHGALLDIWYDPSIAENGLTTGNLPGPSFVQIGPPAFAKTLAWLAHTIAHELEHVRQRKVGVPTSDEREFLAYSVEIMSAGMPEDAIADFFSNARSALAHWNNLSPDDQKRLWSRFSQIRNKIRFRFNSSSPVEQATHKATMDNYNAVVRPH